MTATFHVLTWDKESLSECAGSVETTSVVWPAAASFMAREADKLVLPTPPFPEIIMYLRSVPLDSSSKADSVCSIAKAAATTGCECVYVYARACVRVCVCLCVYV